MFKKILTLMGVGVLLLSLTACTSADPFELLENSQNVMDEVDSMVMDISIDVDVDTGLMSVTVPMTGRMAVDGSSNEMSMDLGASFDMMGQPLEMSFGMHLRDGHLYTDEDGRRDRMPLPFGTSQDEIINSMAIGLDIDEGLVEEVEVEETDSGYRLELTLDPNETDGILPEFIDGFIDGFIEGFIEGFTGAFPGGGGPSDVERIEMILYMDEDHYQESIQVIIEMSMRLEGVDSTVTVDVTMDFVQIGDVNVQFPAWIDQPIGATGGGNVDASGHALIGNWDNGSGRIFLFGIGDPNAVEFRADGTLIITGGRNAGTMNWEPAGMGTITVGHATLTYRVSGDQLTLTDRANDDWIFDRAGGRSSSSNNNRNNDEDWEAFIEEFDAFVDEYIAVIDRLVENPNDLSAINQLEEMTEEVEDYWMERAFAIEDTLSGSDLAAFDRAMNRLVDRVLDALDEASL